MWFLNAIPGEQRSFQAMVLDLFPNAELSGVVIRNVEPPNGPAVTVVFLADLIAADALERLVLAPLAIGPVSGPPETLMRSGRFPAPQLRCAASPQSLADGLLEGLAAVHIDGHEGSLLVGTGQQENLAHGFGPNLGTNIAILRRQVRRVDLHAEHHLLANGGRIALVYLESRAAGATVQAVRTWSLNLSPYPARPPWWQTLLNVFRLPPALESSSPASVAEALTKGYVAVLRDDRPAPLVAPTTLNRLFSSPGDVTLAPALRRTITGPRVLAAWVGLTLSASLVAISSYHHSLIPGPFLVALGTSRANLPLPVVGEMFLVAVISDSFQAVARRAGGQTLTMLVLVVDVLAFMAMMQVGVLGAVSGVVGIVESAVRATLPNPSLRRIVSLWRYLFIGAAVGLGVYGMTMLLFLMLVYLGEERAVEHPVRLPPDALSR